MINRLARPQPWNIDPAFVEPPFGQLEVLFAWDGYPEQDGIHLERVSNLRVTDLGPQFSVNTMTTSEIGRTMEIGDSGTPGHNPGWGWDFPTFPPWVEGSAITVEVLVKPNSARTLGSGYEICRFGLTGNGRIILSTFHDGSQFELRFERQTGGGQNQFFRNNSLALPMDRWIHLLCRMPTFDAGNNEVPTVFLDGAQLVGADSSNGSGTVGTATGLVTIANTGGNDGFMGQIAYVRVYKGLLDGSWARRLYENPWGPIRHYRDTSPLALQVAAVDTGPTDWGTSFEVKPPAWNITSSYVGRKWDFFWQNAAYSFVFFNPPEALDIMSGSTLPLISGTPVYAQGRFGVALDPNNDSQYLDTIGTIGHQGRTLRAITVVSLIETSGNSWDGIVSTDVSDSAGYRLLRDDNDTSIRWRIMSTGGQTNLDLTLTDFTPGDTLLLMATWDTVTMRLYVYNYTRGVRDVGSVARTGTITPVDLEIASINDINPFDGLLYYVHAIEDVLPEAMFDQLVVDPFGPFRYERSVVYALFIQAIIGFGRLHGAPFALILGDKGGEGFGDALGSPVALDEGLKGGLGSGEGRGAPSAITDGQKGGLGTGDSTNSGSLLASILKGGLGLPIVHESSWGTEVGLKGGEGLGLADAHARADTTGSKDVSGEGAGDAHAYAVDDGTKGGEGEGQADAHAYASDDGTKGGVSRGIADAHARGEIAGLKGGEGDGISDAHGHGETVGEKGGEGDGLADAHAYALDDGEKGGEGYGISDALAYALAEGLKGLSVFGDGFGHGFPYALTDGEKGGEGEGIADAHGHGETLGQKDTSGEGIADEHAYATDTGEKGGEGDGIADDHAYALAEGVKGLAIAGDGFGHGFPYAHNDGEKGGEGLGITAAHGYALSDYVKAATGQGILHAWTIDTGVGSKGGLGQALADSHPHATVIGLKGGEGTGLADDLAYALGEGTKGLVIFGNGFGHGFGYALADGEKGGEGLGIVNEHGYGITIGSKGAEGYGDAEGTPVVVAFGIKGGEGLASITVASHVQGLGLKGGEGTAFLVAHGFMHGTQTIVLDAETIDFIRTIARTVDPTMTVAINLDNANLTITQDTDINMFIVTIRDITLEA